MYSNCITRPTGQPTEDASKIGLVLAKNPPLTRYFFNAGPTASNLAIPAGDGNAEVVSELTLAQEAKLVYAQPHMHLRGKDFELRLVFPTGETQTVLKAKWDFEWQMGYEMAKPIDMPKGTRMIGISHFDNSANNRFNPDPAKEIVWGPQNWDEMSNCFIGVIIPTDIAAGKRVQAVGAEPAASRALGTDARCSRSREDESKPRITVGQDCILHAGL